MKKIEILGNHLKNMTKNEIKAEYLKKGLHITREHAQAIKKSVIEHPDRTFLMDKE